jgi:predicted alternative tryptophan synthase beta-subunit
MEVKKIFLPESELPRQWYNIMADMPTPMEPPLHPGPYLSHALNRTGSEPGKVH